MENGDPEDRLPRRCTPEGKEREEEPEEMEEEEAKHYRDWVFVNGKYYYRDVDEEEQQQQQEEEQQEELSQKAQKKEESRQDQEEEEEDQDQDLDSDSLAETVAASEPEALGRQPYYYIHEESFNLETAKALKEEAKSMTAGPPPFPETPCTPPGIRIFATSDPVTPHGRVGSGVFGFPGGFLMDVAPPPLTRRNWGLKRTRSQAEI
jgi:hypothetical protein